MAVPVGRHKPKTVRTPAKRQKFLDVLKKAGSISKACEVAKIARCAAYAWRHDDPEFEKDWLEAIEIGNEYLEDVADKRAVDGTLKPVFYKGGVVGYINEYSDQLLMFRMKGRMPEKYRDTFKEDPGTTTIRIVNVPAQPEGRNSPATSLRTRERLD